MRSHMLRLYRCRKQQTKERVNELPFDGRTYSRKGIRKQFTYEGGRAQDPNNESLSYDPSTTWSEKRMDVHRFKFWPPYGMIPLRLQVL